MTAAARSETIRTLRRQMAASLSVQSRQEIVPTGLSQLDSILPGGGLPTASIVEWISSRSGQFAASIALSSIRNLLQRRAGCLAVIDDRNDFHAAAALSQGIPLSRILLVRPDAHTKADSRRRSADNSRESAFSKEALWALEQTVRCSGVNVVLCWMDRCSNAIMRRLQLAVEHSGVTLVMIRPARVLHQPSFADLRLLVTPQLPQHASATTASSADVMDHANPNASAKSYSIRLLRSRHELQHERSAKLIQIPGSQQIRNS